jgi:hypothetical protein
MSNVKIFRPAVRSHADGSACLEGTRKLPAGFLACCAAFDARTSACTHDVRYEWNEACAQWQIAISAQAGAGGILIAHCPHCGTALLKA